MKPRLIPQSPVIGRIPFAIALFSFVILIGTATFAYIATGRSVSGNEAYVLPLDDAYIHMQYAHEIAIGQPFRYIPGDQPTSGATSLLYPALLAIGDRLGFQGDRLIWWGLAIGVITWLIATWLIFRLALLTRRLPFWSAVLIACAFALSGALDWAFMSGMETGLAVVVMLLTLWCIANDWLIATCIAAGLAAITRPENAVIALSAIGYLVIRARVTPPLICPPRRRWLWLLLPIIAVTAQPLVNLVVTGTLTASGLQAKAYLYNVPFNFRVFLQNVSSGFVRIGSEWLTGRDIDGVQYTTSLVTIGALLAIAWALFQLWRMIRKREKHEATTDRVMPVGLIGLIVVWLLGIAGGLALLETAFWQFKRYQQPLIALLFVLTAWTIGILAQKTSSVEKTRNAQTLFRLTTIGLPLVLLGFSLTGWPTFLTYYRDNIHEVDSVQIAMAHYVAATVPPGAWVGVHDIGVLAYRAGVQTYDVVGLSTANEAAAWRNGPGSIYEQMRHSPDRPDYFAIYSDVHGLGYFNATDLFKTVLIRFESTHPPANVATASSAQIVARADWSKVPLAEQPWSAVILNATKGMSLVDSVNVADLSNEAAHAYHWWMSGLPQGFPTELYQMPTLDCEPNPNNPDCTVLDGGRMITGGESMKIATIPGRDLVWVTRVHPREGSTLSLSVDGQQVAQRVIPGGLGGRFMEIATLIPGAQITGTHTVVQITMGADDLYTPYYHWFYQGTYSAPALIPAVGQFANGALLTDPNISWEQKTHTWHVTVTWEVGMAGAHGEQKVFVHLVNPAGGNAAGTDRYPVHGDLPPGDWLPGAYQETYDLTVPTDQLWQTYTIALGLYNPVSFARVPVTGGDSGDNLILGTVASF